MVHLPRLRALCDPDETDATASTITEKVIDVAAQAFRANPQTLSASDGPHEIPGWDSLAFLDFALRLERRFDLRIAPRDIMAIDTIGAAIAVIERQSAPLAKSA